MPQLGSADEAVSILIEDLESLLDFLFTVSVLHLAGHHGQELGEIDGAVAVSIDFVNHVLELSFCGVLSQRSHHSAQFLGGNSAIAVCAMWVPISGGLARAVKVIVTLIEEGERLLELCAQR